MDGAVAASEVRGWMNRLALAVVAAILVLFIIATGGVRRLSIA